MQKWGIKQAHLESIYSRFARTILRTEHLDFTSKPQFHASLDFLAVRTYIHTVVSRCNQDAEMQYRSLYYTKKTGYWARLYFLLEQGCVPYKLRYNEFTLPRTSQA